MVINRRHLLLGMGAAVLTPQPALAGTDKTALYAAARRDPDGRYAAAIFTADGRDVRAVGLPARGHDLTVCPVTRRCVVFARRPGNFAICFSSDATTAPQRFATPSDRHFYGHGVFSRDGRLLFTTENDFEAARGVIGVYDATDAFRRVGEFSSYGVGPHDLALLSDGAVMVVANGGLREHPDIGGGRRVLNAGAIETSLCYIELAHGTLVERHVLGPPGSLSLRHLDVGHDDTIVLGAQLVGANDPSRGLVFRHRRQQDVHAFALDDDIQKRLAGYVSSVAVDRAGETVAVTSSRGGIAAILDIASGRLIKGIAIPDVSGVAFGATRGGFVLTSGSGRVVSVSGRGSALDGARGTVAWDNHAIRLSQ